jgi:hypothetical protein
MFFIQCNKSIIALILLAVGMNTDAEVFASTEFVINLYNNNLKTFHPAEPDPKCWSFSYRPSTIEVTLEEKLIKDIFDKTQAIHLRPLVESKNPKLVLGCGKCNLFPTDYHLHSEDDTIDPLLSTNPTIVGRFGGKGYESILPNSHYKTVLDEVILADFATEGDIASLFYKLDYWLEIERILEDGGFFLAPFVGNLTRWKKLPTEISLKIPSDSKLKVFGLIDFSMAVYSDRSNPRSRNFQMTALVIAKPYGDGSFPREITESNLPSETKLNSFQKSLD